MAEAQMQKYHFEDKFMYIDLKQAKKADDCATLPFQGQRRTFTVRVPESLQKEIKSAKFSSDNAYLLIATEAISSYHSVQLTWDVLPEMKDNAFSWMLVTGEKMTVQQRATA